MELGTIAVVVAAIAAAIEYAVESPAFDHPAVGDAAKRNFLNGTIVLAALGTAAAWAVWLTWRRRAHLDLQPDRAARLLAIAVATLPVERREWGTAMTAELASLTDRADRWRFAVSGARAALVAPAGSRRPAAGWAGGIVGLLGAAACIASAVYIVAVDDSAAGAPPAYIFVVLVVVLVACLLLIVAAPPALTSSRLARRTGIGLGITSGVALLLWSRAGDPDAGAIGLVSQVQLLTFVIAPLIVAAAARSLRAGLQTICWGFVFSAVTTFPVYILESIRRYREAGGLFLDGDTPSGSSLASNLSNAVTWVLLVLPGLLIPVGVLLATLMARVARSGTAAHVKRPDGGVTSTR
jgi:hypothetical protein